MTLRAYLIILLLMSAAAPLRAEDNQEHEPKEVLEFQIYGDSDGPRNNFDDFIAGLKAEARSGLPQPDQSISQLNFDQPREYKPMNPITIFRW